MKTVDAYWNPDQYELLKQLSEIRERLYDQEELVSAMQSMLTKGISKERRAWLQEALREEFSTTKTLLNDSIAILSNGLGALRKGVSSDEPFDRLLIRSEKDEVLLSDLYDKAEAMCNKIVGESSAQKNSDTISSTPILQFESAPIPSLTVEDYVESVKEEARRNIEYERIMNEHEEEGWVDVDEDEDPFLISDKTDILHNNQFYVDILFNNPLLEKSYQVPPQMIEHISFDAISRYGTLQLRLLTFDGSGEKSFSVLRKLIEKKQKLHGIAIHVLDVSGSNEVGTIFFNDVAIEGVSSEFDHTDGQIIRVDVVFSFEQCEI